MAIARKIPQDLARPIRLELTQDEADYLAKLTSEYRILPEDCPCHSGQCDAESVTHIINRQHIFAALAGVTQPS